MKDVTIPTLYAQNEGVPLIISIPPTQAQIEDQGYFYDGKSPLMTNGYALQFDGSQNYLDIGKLNNFGSNLGSGFYIKFDIKTTSTADGRFGTKNAANEQILIGFNEDFNLAPSSGNMAISISDNSGNRVQAGTFGSCGFNDGGTHTIEIGIGAGENFFSTFKIDGVTIPLNYQSQGAQASYVNFTQSFTIGASNENGTLAHFIACTVDNIKIGTSALNIFASYPFSEGTGATTADSSGNGNTGTLIGTPLPLWVTGFSGAYTDSANFTYNQAGVTYGGLFNQNQDSIPILDTAILEQPSFSIQLESAFLNMVIASTNALLYDQGYTYNQSGFTYNQLLVAYAGIYNQNQDTVPLTLSFEDIYQPFVPPPSGNNLSIGPGFFMFITQ